MGEDRLKEVVASLLMVPVGEITRETLLTTLSNSIGEAKLRLALKRCGADLPAGSRPSTFGVLADLLLSGKPQPTAPPHMPTASDDPGQPLQIGLDIQD